MASTTNSSLIGDLTITVQESLIPKRHDRFLGLSWTYTSPGNVDPDSESLGVFFSSERAEKPMSKLDTGYYQKTDLPFDHPGSWFLHQEGFGWSLPSLVPEDFSGSWETEPLLQNDFRDLLGLLGFESGLKWPEWNWNQRI